MAKKRTRAPGFDTEAPDPQPSTGDDDLTAGITYADESEGDVDTAAEAPDEEPDEDDGEDAPVSQDRLDPDAGRAAVQAMRRRAIERKAHQAHQGTPKPHLPPADPRVVEEQRPRLFRVVETMMLPRGASSMKFPQGKVISSNAYNIDDLVNRGLKLEPYREPARR